MRASGGTSDLTFLLIGLAAMALLAAASFFVAPADTAPGAAGSSFSAHPSGTKAAFVLLKDLGYEAARSFEPFAAVGADGDAAIVLSEPQRPASQRDLAAVRAFVEAGGVLLATGHSALPFLPGIQTGPPGAPADRASFAPAAPSPVSARVDGVEMPVRTVPLRMDPQWVALFGTVEEAAVLSARFGRGRIVWWASSEALSNAALASAGHMELFLNTIGPPDARRVLFDEFYHGHARSFWSYVAGTPVAIGLAQTGIVIALALATFSRRRGPVRPRPVEPRTSPLEFIETVGALYERAHAAQAAVASARARLRRDLNGLTGRPPSTPDARLVQTAARRRDLDAAATLGLLEQSERAAADPKLGERDATRLVSAIQKLAAELEGTARTGTAPGRVRSAAAEEEHR